MAGNAGQGEEWEARPWAVKTEAGWLKCVEIGLPALNDQGPGNLSFAQSERAGVDLSKQPGFR